MLNKALLLIFAVIIYNSAAAVVTNGCSSVSSTPPCPSGTYGYITDTPFSAPTTTTWSNFGELNFYASSVITGLNSSLVYEFRLCYNDHYTHLGSYSIAAVVTDTTTLSSQTFSPCCGTQNKYPWFVVKNPTHSKYQITMMETGCSSLSKAYYYFTAVPLQGRIQPCPTCITTQVSFNSVSASYSLPVNQLVTTDPNYFSCQGVTASPGSISCPQYEIVQNITLQSPSNLPHASCTVPVLVHDNQPSTIICPAAFPTTFVGTQCDTTTSTSCYVSLSDLPLGTYTDACQGDPRFGSVLPDPFTLPTYSFTQATTVSTTYSQVQQDGITVSTSTTPCTIALTILHLMTPSTYSISDAYPINIGETYQFSFVSTIFASPNVDETQFRIFILEVNPPPYQTPELINLPNQIAYKSTHTPGISPYSQFQFIIPNTITLRSKYYYLILQGWTSLAYSVSNPIIQIFG